MTEQEKVKQKKGYWSCHLLQHSHRHQSGVYQDKKRFYFAKHVTIEKKSTTLKKNVQNRATEIQK